MISGCGSYTENISKFVDHHAKSLVPEIDSYIQDTPDLLRELEKLKTTPFPKDTFPVLIDVVGLYPNIPHAEALKCMEEALKTRTDKSVSTKVLIELMELVLKYNIFEFNKKLFIQLIGTAIGTIMAPTVANI